MKTSVPPCPGLPGVKWAAVRAAALDALDRFDAELTEHNWTASELFGVHPQAGVIRANFCGALVLSGVNGLRSSQVTPHLRRVA